MEHLEALAAPSPENGPAPSSFYPTSPRTIIDSGASTSFVLYAATLSSPRPHKTNLRTATGSPSRSSHSGKLQVTRGPAPIILPAPAVPTLQDNLLSVGQLSERHNVAFTK